MIVDDKPVRSLPQNRAIHKYFAMLAESLNNAGLDIKKTMRHDFDIPWTETLVKELIWRGVQESMFDIKSTAKLDTSQVTKVYEVINKHISEKFGVTVIFPTKEEIIK